jgi:hypothetical protein
MTTSQIERHHIYAPVMKSSCKKPATFGSDMLQNQIFRGIEWIDDEK